MNDFEGELESKDHGNGEVQFPDYFRNITGDDELLKKLALLHKAIVLETLPANRYSEELVKAITAILGRLSGASFYHFRD